MTKQNQSNLQSPAMSRVLLRSLIGLALAAFTATSVQATTRTWDGGGGRADASNFYWDGRRGRHLIEAVSADSHGPMPL